MQDVTTSRVEAQFNIYWIQENPDLFKQNYQKFFSDHPSASWQHKSVARPGWLTLIARRKSKVNEDEEEG